jgi:hypothetical protein
VKVYVGNNWVFVFGGGSSENYRTNLCLFVGGGAFAIILLKFEKSM